MTQSRILSVEGVTIKGNLKSSVLVSDLSFDLYRGEVLAIAGESGSGKSLTSLAIMGLLPYPATSLTSGRIMFDGSDISTYSDRQMRHIRGQRIGMIFQEPMTSLNPILKIGKQLTETIGAHKRVGHKSARARAIDALRSVHISEPERRLDQYPYELSGGMRQRVMIAMCLSLSPDIIIADEPTTALDVTTQIEILELLKELQKDRNAAVIIITHDLGVVAELADRVLILKEGEAIETNPVRELFQQPKYAYTKSLLSAVPSFRPENNKLAETEIDKTQPLLAVKDLTVNFDLRGGAINRVVSRLHAVESVSFDVYPNETFAIVGESGCGKSTTAKAITSLIPSKGQILFEGTDLNSLTKRQLRALRADLQIVFQDPYASLDSRNTVGSLVREPLDVHDIYKPQQRNDQVAELFSRVGLNPDWVSRYPHEFSGGQRQRICIARALATKPKFIIADESVSALDVVVQEEILDLLKDLQSEFGTSYLFISHDMAVVNNIADRVAVMHMGQIVETGTCSQVFSNPQHPYTKVLISSVLLPDPAYVRPYAPSYEAKTKSPIRKLGDPPELLTLTDVGSGHLVADS